MNALHNSLKIAIMADIHGNALALEATLEDIEMQGGVDEYWFLGDFVALGPDPLRVLEKLTTLQNTRFIRGNTDRYVCDQQLQSPDIQDINGLTAAKLVKIIRMASSFSWTAGAVATGNWLPWLQALPMEMRARVPDGTRVLAVHAAPGMDDGDGINPVTNNATLRLLMADIQADLVVVGHTHSQFDRLIDGIRVINPGSISNPLPPDLRAGYALLQADQSGYQIYFKHVDYNRQAVIEAMHEHKHPSKNYVTRLMLGQVKPDWEN